MATKTAKDQDELAARLERLKRIDQAIHKSMPVGGNAHHEQAQQLIGDEIRALMEELAK